MLWNSRIGILPPVARRRKPTGDKSEWVPSQPLPEWINTLPGSDVSEDATEYLTKRAAYIGSSWRPRDQSRLDWLINSRWTLGAESIAQWNELLSVYYPTHPLEPDETHHTPSDDAKAKAHCLKHALTRLLELVGAPAVVVSDLQCLLSGYPIKEQKAYSQTQRELLLDATVSYRRIEEKTGVDQSDITQAVKAGHLIDPWREGRT